MLFSIIFIASFTANITTSLTIDELIWLTVVKRENISCPTGIQRFLVVG